MQGKKPYIPHRQQLPLPSAAAFMLISQEIATKPGTWKLRQNCCGHKAMLNHKADKPNPKNKKKGKHLGMGSPSSHSHQYHPTSLRTTQRQVKRGHSTFLPLLCSPTPKCILQGCQTRPKTKPGLGMMAGVTEDRSGESCCHPFFPSSSVVQEAEASISVILGPALSQQLPVVGPSCGCRRACLVTALEQARMYLRVLARHEQKGPGTTIKGNILHSFQKELVPRAVQAQALDDWNSFM